MFFLKFYQSVATPTTGNVFTVTQEKYFKYNGAKAGRDLVLQFNMKFNGETVPTGKITYFQGYIED